VEENVLCNAVITVLKSTYMQDFRQILNVANSSNFRSSRKIEKNSKKSEIFGRGTNGEEQIIKKN